MIPSLRALPLLCAALLISAGCDCGGRDPALPDPDKAALTPAECTPRFADAGVTVLAAGLDRPGRLATDGFDLYFTLRAGNGAGEVRRTSLTQADAGSVVVASGFDTPDAIAVDATHLYVTDEVGLWRVAKDSAEPPELLFDLATNAIGGEGALLDEGAALVVSTGLRWLARVPKAGGEPEVLHTAPAGAAVKSAVRDRGDLYFLVAATGEQADAGGLYRLTDGEAVASRLFAEPTLGRSLEVTREAFFWSEGTGLEGEGAVKSRSRLRASADAGVVVHAQAQWSPGAFAVDRPYVYFAARTAASPSNPPAPEFLLRASQPCDDGGVTPVGPEGFGPGAVLLFDDRLYFTSAGVAGEGYVGRVP